MNSPRHAWILTVLAMLAPEGAALAQEHDDRPAEESPTDDPAAPSVWDRKIALYGHVAFTGGPFGPLGASLEYAPTPLLAMEIGGGVGLGSGRQGGVGPQGAALLRVKPVRGTRWAFTAAGGPSVGDYGVTVWTLDQTDGALRYRPAIWMNAEVAAEARLEGGFAWRAALGVSQMLNPGAGRCPMSSCYVSGQSPTTLLYVDFGFGYSAF